MSTPDITRFLKQPTKQYGGARLQQGRILTDADYNEGAWLHEEERRRSVLDFVGSRGSPDGGFSLGEPLALNQAPPDLATPLKVGDDVTAQPFTIGVPGTLVRPVSLQAGSFYLAGRRFDLEQPQPFMFQRDFLQMGPADIPDAVDDGTFIYYLNAWEQDISVVEDDEFREPALGGSDTSLRVRRMRRVEAQSVPGAAGCENGFLTAIDNIAGDSATFQPATGELVSNARLRLDFNPASTNTICNDDCNPAQSGPYLGADNQTLRIMLTAVDTFVWSKDDAAPLYRAQISGLDQANPTTVTVKLLTPPADEEHFPLVGRVVEILPFAALLDDTELPGSRTDPHFDKAAGEIGAFTRVIQPYDPNTQTFTVDPFQGIPKVQTFVTAWDSQHPDHDRLNHPDLPATTDRFFYLRFWHTSVSHAGVDVELSTDQGPGGTLGDTLVAPTFSGTGRPGDFWIATVRPETPEPILPIALRAPGDGVPPDGPRHFYAPLTWLQVSEDHVAAISDCRPRIRPTGDDDCSTVTVGDCFGSIGDFQTIGDAIDALPPDGGVVTVRPGVYHERVVINRPGITLEGCGETTVLRSPSNGDGSNATAVIQIQEATGTRVRAMRIEAAEESAIIASGPDLAFEALHMVAGSLPGDGTFDDTTAVTDAPLLDVESADLSLRAVVVETLRRPGLVMDSSSLIVEGASFTGNQDAPTPAAGPMLSMNDCTASRINNLTLQTFGQFGISMTGTLAEDIEITGLDATASFLSATPAVPPLAVVQIDGIRQARLAESRIVMTNIPASFGIFGTHAAVVVQGDEIRIETTHIETTVDGSDTPGPAAWGGIQLRGGSSRVLVRDNHIIGGIGHGITLGSVAWVEVDNTGNQLPDQGAGQTQVVLNATEGGYGVIGLISTFQDNQGVEFMPQLEGLLSDITIMRNRIENMSSNGISMLTVLGLPLGGPNGPTSETELLEVERLRIEGNIITSNLQRLVPQNQFVESPIAEAEPNNPTGASIPLLAHGGIVLASVGESADIRANVIANNSSNVNEAICGIFIFSGEGLSIVGNRIQNNGGIPQQSDQPNSGVRAGIAIMLAGTGTPSTLAELKDILSSEGDTLTSDGSTARLLDNVVRQPEGRALHLVAAGPVTVANNFFSSQGFHGSGSGEDEFAIGDVVLIEDLGGPWERFDVGQLNVSGDVFIDFEGGNTFGLPGYLNNTVEASPRFFIGVGGQVLFQNNQVIYDWHITRVPTDEGVPLGIFAVALLGLDHIGCVGNHLSMHVTNIPEFIPPADPDLPETARPTPILSHLFIAAGALDVSNNRVASAVIDSLLSIWAEGEMGNITVGNQTSLANHTSSNKDIHNVIQDNQVMFEDLTIVNTEFIGNTGMRAFFHLMFRPAQLGPPPAPPSDQ
jgi:hypothetical protein